MCINFKLNFWPLIATKIIHNLRLFDSDPSKHLNCALILTGTYYRFSRSGALELTSFRGFLGYSSLRFLLSTTL
jgi:hypothetical protein